jgi:signal transduction histidine kinase
MDYGPADAFYGVGACQYMMGHPGPARDYAELALARDPASPLVRILAAKTGLSADLVLGLEELRTNRPAEAWPLLWRAARQNRALAWRSLASCALLLGRLEIANLALERSEKLEPTSVDLEALRSAVEAAMEVFLRRVDIPSYWQRRGVYLFRRGRSVEAVEAFENAVRLAPRNAAAWANLAMAAWKSGDWDRMGAALDRALALDPSNAGARYLKAVFLRHQGRDHLAALQLQGLAASPALRLEADPRQLRVLDAYRRVSLALGAAGLVLCALAGALAAAWVLRPVQWMAQAVQGAAIGGAPSAAPAGRDDELGRAASAVAGSLRSLESERTQAGLRREMAERRSRELNQVAHAIAHEVRNPLAVIRGQADLLQRTLADPAAGPLLERVRRQVDHLDRVVGLFLELGRVPRPTLRAIQARELVRGLVDSLRASKPSQAWTVVDGGAPDLSIQGDAALLEGALLNLGLNALQAMPSGGEVRVAAVLREGALCLEVADQGPGLDLQTRARLFEPFFTTKTGGNGLGLALARRAAEAHGGELRLLESPQGACFGLFLPCDEGSV